MTIAIHSYPSPAAVPAAASAVSLEARLVRSQKELSDCVNCDSAKTPEGKEKIQAISNRIGEIKSQLEALDTVRPNRVVGGNEGGAVASNNQRSPTVEAQGRIGGLINTFA